MPFVTHEEVVLTGLRRSALGLALALGMLIAHAPDAGAAAEIHRLNLVLSSNPTQIQSGDFNDFLSNYNTFVLGTRGLEGIDKLSFSWYHQAEMRYFVRPNLAVSAGIGYIRARSTREFLPRIAQAIEHRAEVLSVPVHVGGTYYLAPYNQGDFQARAYVGGGFMAYTGNKVVFERLEFATDSATTLGGSLRTRAGRDAPGYYVEVGGHMFFAARYSVMLGVIYRGGLIRNMTVTTDTFAPDGTLIARRSQEAEPTFSMDFGGVGMRMGLAIGF